MGVPLKLKSISKPIKSSNDKLHKPNNWNRALKCGTWNIRRGLLTREAELKNLLIQENLDILFLTETDSKNLVNDESYVIQGYKTILPLISLESDTVRLCVLSRKLSFQA